MGAVGGLVAIPKTLVDAVELGKDTGILNGSNEETLRRRIQDGDTDAVRSLGALLQMRGRFADAERVYRDALQRGVVDICDALGDLLEFLSREDEAERLYRRAVDDGCLQAYRLLGYLVFNQDDRENEAESLFLAGIDAGQSDCHEGVGDVKSWRDQDLMAEWSYRRAEAGYRARIASGDTTAYSHLATVLWKLGEEKEAEVTFQKAIELGHANAAQKLGHMLAELPGREKDAERAFRNAIKAGCIRAFADLADLLAWDMDRTGDAEAVYRQAINTGLVQYYEDLGDLLDSIPGRGPDAERAFRAAIANGDTDAYLPLGNLLAKQQGRKEDAQVAYRQAVLFGNTDAVFLLAKLVADIPGRESEAVELFHKALNADIFDAYAPLGQLLARLPGREAESVEMFREAIENGYLYAYEGLGHVLAKMPGREREAAEALRSAIGRGNTYSYHALTDLLIRWHGLNRDTVKTLQEAENTFRREAEGGEKRRYWDLGFTLQKLPDRQTDAEKAYRTATNLGVTRAFENLGWLLVSLDRLREAEWAFKKAIAAGHHTARAGLNELNRRKKQANLLGRGGKYPRLGALHLSRSVARGVTVGGKAQRTIAASSRASGATASQVRKAATAAARKVHLTSSTQGWSWRFASALRKANPWLIFLLAPVARVVRLDPSAPVSRRLIIRAFKPRDQN